MGREFLVFVDYYEFKSPPNTAKGPNASNQKPVVAKDKDIQYDPNAVELAFVVWQRDTDEQLGRYATMQEAIAVAKKHNRVTVTNPRVIVWDNIRCKVLSEQNKELKSLNTIKEGIDYIYVNKLVNAKVVDIQTNRVVYDNFPKQCGTCESPIQNEY